MKRSKRGFTLFKPVLIFSLIVIALNLAATTPEVRGQTTEPACTDSDGGLAYDVAGFVEGVGPNGFPFTKTDVCETSGTFEGQLREFYCNGTTPWPSLYECPNGCVNGACVPETCTDADGDGYAIEGGGCGLVDCNDSDPDINPGAAEVCGNGIDDDCDGAVDGDDAECAVCTDADGDGYAVEGGACGLVDCNDTDANVNPGAAEICDNGVDDDCDGAVDDDDADCGGGPSCTDSDGGLNYEVAGFVEGVGANGFTFTRTDVCETSGTFEGQLREFYCNGTTPWPNFYECPNGCVDGACVPETCTDADGDGFAAEGGACGPADCDDTNPTVNPGATEVCGNAIDDNCNGLVDDDDPVCSGTVNVVIVGWDGVQRDHFWECYNKQLLPECANGLPNIQALSGGVIFNATISSGDTATKPGWAQIFSGYNAEVMGIYSNGEYQPLPEGYSVFEKLENHFGADNIVTMLVSGKNVNTGGACIGDPTTVNGQPAIEDQGQPYCWTKFNLDYYENDLKHNETVGNRALELLTAHQNDLFFASFIFRAPDVYGHVAGENSESYSRVLVDDDVWLGQIVSKLQELGIDDRTLVYVTTDHGFDEGGNRHGNAPYTFLATNDPLVVRSGDRKDVAPTILERYGVSVGPIGNAPAVDGYSLYRLPPLACIPEGSAFIDYPGAPVCCAGLQLISLDEALGQTLVPATGGTGDNSGFCTDCGNGVCQEPENMFSCPADCP